MAEVTFTPNLKRHVDCPTVEVPGTTVAEVLARVFPDNPRLRGYVVDDRGRLFFVGCGRRSKTADFAMP